MEDINKMDKNKITHKQYVTRTTLIKVITALYIIGVMVALVIVAPLISLMGSLGNVLFTFLSSLQSLQSVLYYL